MSTARVLRGVGWMLIGSGALLLLYIVYLLAFTNVTTQRAQGDLLATWQAQVGGLPVGGSEDTGVVPVVPRPPPAAQPEVELGNAHAVIWFQRPDMAAPIVHDGPLLVVEGVAVEQLKRGPGHYPLSGQAGQPGNFAIAGHRTTYGAPFLHLDQLTPGDEVHVVDRQGREWTYVVRTSQIVSPNDVWVLGEDPLGTGEPTMTLTTCHPRFSAAQRLVVFAALPPRGVL
ncbi:MAG: class E sortase [Actinomycetota bacterium]|nr:class E sortase [Actinomycetota bacterium]